MKKHLALLAGLAMLSGSAYATKARMGALGQGIWSDSLTSYYISDTRSIFRNPAELAGNTKYLVFEWGTQDEPTVPAAPGLAHNTVNDEFLPGAEGGYFGIFPAGHGHYAYGVYLGRKDNEANGNCERGIDNNRVNATVGRAYINCVGRTSGGVDALGLNFLPQDNGVDLFFAGSYHNGFKWGVNLYYAQGDDSGVTSAVAQATVANHVPVDRDSETHEVRAGMMWKNISVWAHLVLKDAANGATTVAAAALQPSEKAFWKSNSNWTLGASYVWRKWTFYIEHHTREARSRNSADVAGDFHLDQSRDRTLLGAGYQKKLNAKTTLFANLAYWNYDANYNFNFNSTAFVAAGTQAPEKHDMDGWKIPLSIAVETHITDWLEGRVSVSQNLVNSEKHTVKHTLQAEDTDLRYREFGSTNVNAGATLHFGNLKIDGLVGTTTHNIGNSAGSERGELSLDTLLTRVGVHYHF